MLRTRLGILRLDVHWLNFRQRRARLQREAITRQRFHRSIADRDRQRPRRPRRKSRISLIISERELRKCALQSAAFGTADLPNSAMGAS